MGRGCGPLLVAREATSPGALRDKPVAIPGRMTTANLLLQLEGSHRGPRVEMPFDRIMPAVAAGEVDAGVIIHEGRFTYPLFGLKLVLDLGEWWESTTGLPLPLGGIVMKRSLGKDMAQVVEGKIAESLRYARDNREEPWSYVRSHAQEMEPRVIQQHIDMFVNDFSLHMGQEGGKAIGFLLEAAGAMHGLRLPRMPLFWDDG